MKRFLVFLAILCGAVCTQAREWEFVNTNIPDFNLFIDKDSVRYIEPHVALYSILYGDYEHPVKVAFIKSDFKKQYIGVIASQEYDEESYRPEAVLKNPHVFMKPLDEKSFLRFPHRILMLKFNKENIDMFDNFVDINTANNADKDYITQLSKEFAKNWNPPMSAFNTESEVIVKIGSDGSLQDAVVYRSGADEAADRAIFAAIENSVPFAKFSNSSKDVMKIKFKFKFDNFIKYVK